jgi:hypothetical protein
MSLADRSCCPQLKLPFVTQQQLADHFKRTVLFSAFCSRYLAAAIILCISLVQVAIGIQIPSVSPAHGTAVTHGPDIQRLPFLSGVHA